MSILDGPKKPAARTCGTWCSNDRFLILPTVQVKNLASHVLAVTLKRLLEDWEQRYAVRPVLAETFVDPSRYKGTCYRAANWTAAGRDVWTSGWHCQGDFDLSAVSAMAEWLCAEPPRPRLGEAIASGIAAELGA